MNQTPVPSIESLLRDQRQRWGRGDCLRVEAYLQQYPSLHVDSEALLDLIYNEIYLRECNNEMPSREEYQQRFPDLAASIGVQFDVHLAIAASLPPTVESTPIIPGYELLEEVGRGGMGHVYRARDQKRNRLVAVKTVRAEYHDNRTVHRRFVAEAQAVAALDHPHIVKVLEAGECAVGPYFVMELIQGTSLEEVIRQGKLPIMQAVDWLIPVAEAVHYAHGKGIIHRDLKPANVLLKDEGGRMKNESHSSTYTPIITDFGMAKILRSGGANDISPTKNGTVLGTPAYMPPEQAGADLGGVGPHSDVYSLGGILYALLTGRAPFDEGDPLETLLKVRSAEPPLPVRSLRPEVSALLEGICHKCLSKVPADRFQSAEEFITALREVAQTLDPPSGEVPVDHQTAKIVLGLLSLKTAHVIPLVKPTMVLGRAPDCDVVLSEAEVSRRHCRITCAEGEAFLEDLESTYGTCVNGSRVNYTHLHTGDRIELGGHMLELVSLPPRLGVQ